jgi:hypothetical protein
MLLCGAKGKPSCFLGKLKTRLTASLGYHDFMSVTLPLNEMSLPEKLRMMEALWEDLSRNSDALDSPAWHDTVLQERERRIAAGEAHFSDWDRAKADIRKRCCANIRQRLQDS